MLNERVRTRFAPSPTGVLHIGSARTALFNWLYARAKGGEFFLRVEDTDLERSKREYESSLYSSLRWMGVDWDNEGSVMRQSERFAEYKKAAEFLITKGFAYKDDGTVRFKMPKNQIITVEDYIMGKMTTDSSTLDDFVILRGDGTATFMLANVVDDEAMEITHVIRGPEHLSNTFRQQPLLTALGYKVPKYSHLSLIHNQQGQKLSKRDGATGVNEYAEMGILPDAFCNYVLRLGWGFGNTEIITMAEVIKIFDLRQLSTSPARVDPNKLTWLNRHYMRNTPIEKIRSVLALDLPKISDGCMANIIEKSNTLREVETVVRRIFGAEGVEMVDKPDALEAAERDFILGERLLRTSPEDCKEKLLASIDAAGLNRKRILMFYRIALTGARISPGLFEVICNLSKEAIEVRVKAALCR